MRIALTSDLHRGFSRNTDRIQRKYFEKFFSENQVDALILAGDIASHDPQTQIRKQFAMIRRIVGSELTIGAVRGNHDLWCHSSYPTLDWQNTIWSRACEQHGVVDLEANDIVLGNVQILGWFSWWAGLAPDSEHLSPKVRPEEYRQLEEDTFRLMSDLYRWDIDKHILVTHMAPAGGIWSSRPRTLPPADALMSGHTHLLEDRQRNPRGVPEGGESPGNGIRVLNSGPDYDKPSIYIYDTETGLFTGAGGNTHRRY